MATAPLLRSLGSGLVGALTVTLVNEGARRLAPNRAPRLERLGQRGLARGMRRLGRRPPASGPPRYWAAMLGDVVLNTLYYSLVGAGRGRPWLRGTVLGASAGAGAVALPPRMGLGRRDVSRTRAMGAMTAAWYLLGGLAAAAAAGLLLREDGRP